MSLAVGIDLQPIAEVEDSLRTFGKRYTRLLYTSAELRGLSSDPHLAARDLATLFAAKEAVMKVLLPSDDIPSWREIEVRNTDEYSPFIALRGVAAELARRQGINGVAVALGFLGECATATAVAQKSNNGDTR